jgi:HAD superfamily hydrolase (TIGR01509 family)
MLRPLRAVFFDMDGLIADTETPDYETWRDLLAERGVALSLDAWTHRVGTSTRFGSFLGELGIPEWEWESLRARKRELYVERVRRDLRPMPGFAELLARVRRWGAVCGVVSTSGRDWVDFILGGLGILDEFHFTLSGSDVARVKPHPDLYELAVRKAAASPSECLALEDSDNGVRAAHTAGVPVIAVPNAITRGQVFAEARARVPSLAHVDDATLRGLGFRPLTARNGSEHGRPA